MSERLQPEFDQEFRKIYTDNRLYLLAWHMDHELCKPKQTKREKVRAAIQRALRLLDGLDDDVNETAGNDDYSDWFFT